MNKIKFIERYRRFSLVGLMLFSLNSLSAAELEEVTTQLVLTGGEHISGKHFKCENKNPYIAVVVSGDNVTIDDSLFTGCYAGIIIAGAKNTTITGNRFEDVGLAIRERRNEYRESSKGTSITFNEFQGVGTKNCLEAPEWMDGPNHDYWACDVYLANAQASFGKFNNNLIDNRGKRTSYIEDFINIGDGSHDYEVKDNTVIGSSEPHSSSATAAWVVVDTKGSNFNVSGNKCYDAATSGLANAGGDNVLINNNLVYITKKHALMTLKHPHSKGRAVGDTSGMSSSTYANRGCGKNTRITNNSVYAYYIYFDKSGNLRDTGITHNWEDGFGDCTNYSYLSGNNFHTSDPQWNVPNNLFANLSSEYFSSKNNTGVTPTPVSTPTSVPTTPTPAPTPAPTVGGHELIKGGGNANGILDKSKWSFFGRTYGLQTRSYRGKDFIYSTPRDNGSGMYQAFSTEKGKTYEVSAILIGSDTNRKEQFNGYSYLTVGSRKPSQNSAFVFAQSKKVMGGTESLVSLTFIAKGSTTYLSLRSDAAWHYANARAFSVKMIDGGDVSTPAPAPTPVPTSDPVPTTLTLSGHELIQGGGNANGLLDKSKWSSFGRTYGLQNRSYRGKDFIYSTAKDSGSGMYQSFRTEKGKTYEVSAILIGSDTNRKEQFNGYSYLTVSSRKPTQNASTVFAESDHIEGAEEQTVSFSFVAKSTTTYLALRSDATWHYANARALSVKAE